MSMKLKTAAALAATLFSLNASADFLRAEAGIGVFNAEPGGTFDPKNGSPAINLNVITSYSIHYTKLYDPLQPVRAEQTGYQPERRRSSDRRPGRHAGQ